MKQFTKPDNLIYQKELIKQYEELRTNALELKKSSNTSDISTLLFRGMVSWINSFSLDKTIQSHFNPKNIDEIAQPCRSLPITQQEIIILVNMVLLNQSHANERGNYA